MWASRSGDARFYLSVTLMTSSYGSSSPCSAWSFAVLLAVELARDADEQRLARLAVQRELLVVARAPSVDDLLRVLVAEHDDVDAGGRVDRAHDQARLRRRDGEPVAVLAAAEVTAHAPARRQRRRAAGQSLGSSSQSGCGGPQRTVSVYGSSALAVGGVPSIQTSRTATYASVGPIAVGCSHSPRPCPRASLLATRRPCASNSSSTRSTPGMPSSRACSDRGPLPARHAVVVDVAFAIVRAARRSFPARAPGAAGSRTRPCCSARARARRPGVPTAASSSTNAAAPATSSPINGKHQATEQPLPAQRPFVIVDVRTRAAGPARRRPTSPPRPSPCSLAHRGRARLGGRRHRRSGGVHRGARRDGAERQRRRLARRPRHRLRAPQRHRRDRRRDAAGDAASARSRSCCTSAADA